jgi:hypothetical protein
MRSVDTTFQAMVSGITARGKISVKQLTTTSGRQVCEGCEKLVCVRI